MARLPIFQTQSKDLTLLQNNWAAKINPVLANPLNTASILKGVVLASGDNVINTLLGRTAQGWFITDASAAITVYRSAPFNDLTLTLNSSGAATINLAVF